MRFAKGKGKETKLASSLGSAVIPQGSEATGTQKANLRGPHSQPPPPRSAIREVKGEQTLGQSFSLITEAWVYTRAQGVRY